MSNLEDQLKAMKAKLASDNNFIARCMQTDPEAKAPVTRRALDEYHRLEREIRELEQKLATEKAK